ncbi:tyrosine-type recombinase/integrase [Pseudomonas sp. PDM31]|uniref:tyrosine-type recombinase/integrase n=1 Tax=Pseudomonas sp. PDM31 TaxID=2854778 RepID=UPI001C44B91C|nr:tyrosine-type recombinase/integrase [Pseudomonas sp. PDM31]MBV7477865.1 tyrosine-type recombinase/integrase [Pseudomonas sp. PDM31]
MASNASKTVNDQKVKGMTPGCSPLVESLPGRGTGALVFKRANEGSPVCYYRYHLAGKQVLIKLGVYRRNAREVGLALPELRDQAAAMAQIAKAHGDVKAYLAKQEADAEAARTENERAVEAARLKAEGKARERQHLAEIEASCGTFGELFLDYIDSRRGRATAGVIKELERLYQTNMLAPHPSIMAMKARDIRPDHILAILNPIWDRGAKVQAERMRSFLSAAFNHGLRAENAVGRSSAKSYNLVSNPATVVVVEKVSAPATRALSDAELSKFWGTVETTEGIGPVMALLFKFVISTGGQRILNICQTTWDDYDLEAGTVRLVHRKGRGGQTMSRPHLVPLTERAVAILERVKEINGCHPWPWTTTGKQHIVVSSPRHALADWLKSEHAVIDGKQTPSFSPRDLRRTCTQLMQRYGISDQLSDLLQAHGQTGVANLHYRNNPEAALPEKQRAIELFEHALAKVLGKKQTAKVVRLSGRR